MSKCMVKAAGQQQKLPRVDLVGYVDTLLAGTYSGFYDVTEPGGAKSGTDVIAVNNNDRVFRLTQLSPSGTASDITMVKVGEGGLPTEDPFELWLRKDVVSAAGFAYPKKPFVGMKKAILAGDEPDDVGSGQVIVTLGNGGSAVKHLMFIYYGIKTLHEVRNETWDGIQLILDTYPQLNLPVPMEPGTLAVRLELLDDVNPSKPVITYWVNGVEQPPVDNSQLQDVDPAIGLDFNYYLMALTFPCWVTQKLLLTTKRLTLSEIGTLNAHFHTNSDMP